MGRLINVPLPLAVIGLLAIGALATALPGMILPGMIPLRLAAGARLLKVVVVIGVVRIDAALIALPVVNILLTTALPIIGVLVLPAPLTPSLATLVRRIGAALELPVDGNMLAITALPIIGPILVVGLEPMLGVLTITLGPLVLALIADLCLITGLLVMIGRLIVLLIIVLLIVIAIGAIAKVKSVKLSALPVLRRPDPPLLTCRLPTNALPEELKLPMHSPLPSMSSIVRPCDILPSLSIMLPLSLCFIDRSLSIAKARLFSVVAKVPRC